MYVSHCICRALSIVLVVRCTLHMSRSLQSLCSPVAHQPLYPEKARCAGGRSRTPAVAGSSSDVVLTSATQRRQPPGPPWVEELKKRMPRHRQGDAEEDWLLAKSVPSGERWFQAEQTMLKRRDEKEV